MVKEGLIVTTPSEDYDDSYCIQYSKDHNGLVVTNDKFRDFVAKSKDKAKDQHWVQQQRISYTFHHDEFLPNPDHWLFDEFPLESYK
mmetsp:Transcript_19661/g.14386  ORF Transcript_19661/g.14386 Transcript_19661/m.14386 type:complete len:87 (+) Transcript_19661:2039-2299(+)